MSQNSKTYKLHPRKVVAKSFMGYLATVGYLGVAALAVTLVIRYANTGFVNLYLVISLILLISLLIFVGNFFDWYQWSDVSIDKFGVVTYKEKGLVNIMGQKPETFIVNDLTSVNKKGNKIVLEGRIKYIDETGRSSEKTKCVVRGTCEEYHEMYEGMLNALKIRENFVNEDSQKEDSQKEDSQKEEADA